MRLTIETRASLRNMFTAVLLALLAVFSSTVAEEGDQAIDLRNFGIPFHFGATTKDLQISLSLLLNSSAYREFDIYSFSQSLTNSKNTVGVDCQNDTSFILSGLESFNVVSLKYFDAAAKLPQGILQGKWSWVGDYQECYAIEKVQNPATNKTFQGKYFTGFIYLNGKPIIGSYPIVLGFCLPNSCGADDGKELLSILLPTSSGLSVPFAVADEERKLDAGAITMMVISGILVWLVVMGTAADFVFSALWDENESTPKFVESDVSAYYVEATERTGLLSGEILSDTSIQGGKCNEVKKKVLNVCRAFSFISNAKKLFSTSTAVGPLACLNGLRVLSMWWVILGHTYAFAATLFDNPVEALDIGKRISYRPIINGTFSVDTFFFLSGLLVAYLAIKEVRDKGKLNWVYFILHRFWRLTPLYAYVLFSFTYLFVYTISGPYRAFIFYPDSPFQKSLDSCKSDWWTNLLYINNMYPDYGNLGETCIGWSWYLANDMQFYIFLSPIVIILLCKNRKVGILVAGFLIVACVVIRAVFVWYYGIYGMMSAPTKHTDDPWGKNGPLYARPYARWSVYLVGMLTGYILAITNNRIRFYKLAALVCWCVAIGTALSLVYADVSPTISPSANLTLTQSGFYNALCRTAWGLCLSWVVLACVSGNGGPIKHILSWKFWGPLGRLTYAAYLVHPIVIYIYYLRVLQPIHYSDLTMVYLFLAHLVTSYVLAFIVSMVVEAPMIQLEKLVRPTQSNR